MLNFERTAQFKRDYKREIKGRHRKTVESDLRMVIIALVNSEPLDERYKDHALTGNWQDHRDCHVKP